MEDGDLDIYNEERERKERGVDKLERVHWSVSDRKIDMGKEELCVL